MSGETRVQLRHPSPASPLRAGLAAIIGLAVGLLLVGATFGEHRTDEPSSDDEALALDPGVSPERPPDSEGSGSAPENTEPVVDERAGDDPADPAGDLTADPESNPAEDPTDEGLAEANPVDEGLAEANAVEDVEATPAPLPTGPGDATFTRGRLAYLRCGDLADDVGRCPRDRGLEESAWSMLDAAATHCGLGSGSGDARFHFEQAAAASELRVRDFGDSPLDGDALSACLSPFVPSLRTTLPGSFILSIRFELR